MWLLYLRFDDQGQVKTCHVRTYSKTTVKELITRAERHGLTSTAQLVECAAFIVSGTIKLKPMIAPSFHFYTHEEFIERWTAVDAPAVAVEDAARMILTQRMGSLAGQGSMPLDEDAINSQRTLLATYRRTLANYIQRLALLTTAHAPPEITHGITEARANIARVKAILRTSGVAVEDHPDDEAPPTYSEGQKH